MSAFVDINNPSNYKNCSKKQYEIYVCMPPKNTVVINKLEQADVVKALGGKTYFTVEQIEKMQKSNPSMLAQLQQLVAQGRAYAVTDATPFVLCGTVGEMWAIKADKLASTYNFLQGGQPLQINQQSLGQRMKNGLLDWTLVRTSPQATAGQNMACFVPSAQKGQIQTSWGAVLNYNGVGISHGKGDFIVCGKLPNGQPNLGDRWVVNGEIFATTYNNQGWTDCLNRSTGIKNITIDSLPRLVPQINNINTGVDFSVFKQKCDTLMKELQKVYKFNVKSNTYENVKDYRGMAQEVEFNGDCYVAKYIVEGNFSHTYSVKDKVTGSMTEETVTATETDVWFGCSAVHNDSAIAMTIRPNTDGMYLSGWPFPGNSNTKVTDDYWSCKVGTIKDINCAEEVKLFEQKCNERDIYIDNRKKSEKSFELSKNNLFSRYISSLSKECVSITKDDSTIITDMGICTKSSNGKYVANGLTINIGSRVNASYKHFVRSEKGAEEVIKDLETFKNLAGFSNFTASYFVKNLFMEIKKSVNDDDNPFLDMSLQAFYKNVVLKETLSDKVYFTTIRKDSNSEYASIEFVSYLPICFKGKTSGKPYCAIAKLADVRFNNLKDCFDFTIIDDSFDSANGIDIDYLMGFETDKFFYCSKMLLSDNEKFRKDLISRTETLSVFESAWRHHREYIQIVDKSKSTLHNVMVNFTDKHHRDVDNGFFTSSMTERARKIFNRDFVDGNFLLCARLFIHMVSHGIKSNDKFFSLHPIKDIRYETYQSMRRVIIQLQEKHCFYQIFGEGEVVELHIGTGREQAATLKVTKSMLDECYKIIDSSEKVKNYTNENGCVYRSVPEVYEKLRETRLYGNIKSGFAKFTKSRKPSEVDCQYIFNEAIDLFSSKVTSYGLNILKPFNNLNSLASSDSITIDGDNDNHLTLYFKLELTKESYGIKISGRTDGKQLNYTHTIENKEDLDYDDKVDTNVESVITDIIEKDVCEYLGVSKWKRFCTSKALDSMYVKCVYNSPSKESRRSKLTKFTVPVFKAHVTFKETTDALLIRVQFPGNISVEDSLTGDIDATTFDILNKKLLTLLVSRQNNLIQSAINSIINYDYSAVASGVYDVKSVLSKLSSINGNSLSFTSSGEFSLLSVINQDGTVSNDSYCIGDNYRKLSLDSFPEAIVVFMNMSHYYSIH